MDNTVENDRLLFRPLNRCCLLRTYQIFSAEHAGWFVAQRADLSLRLLSWASVVASGAKQELNLLWQWQLENRRYCKDKAEAVFERHILGDDKVLGMQFGWDGTKVIYVSSVDLSRCGYFYDPIAMLLETGLQLTPEMLDD